MNKRLQAALHSLYSFYGDQIHQTHPTGKPLDVLVHTILSQHTSDTNSSRAFEQVRTTFQDWHEVLHVDTDVLAGTIRSGGLANIKARRIQSTLAHILKHEGDLTLDHIAVLSVTDGYKKLLAMPGVGRKTAACVLLFSLGKAACPVDTHVFRVLQRLGLPKKIKTPEQTAIFMEQAAADLDLLRVHCTLITHGRTICKARAPRCIDCPAVAHCRTGSKKVKKTET